MSRFALTRAAVIAFDADRPRRDALWDAVETEADFILAVATDREAADKVREAFAEDTKDYNSRARAFLIHPDDENIRRWIREST